MRIRPDILPAINDLNNYSEPLILDMVSKKQRVFFNLLISIWFISILIFFTWWFDVAHLNGYVRFSINTIILFWVFVMPAYFFYFIQAMADAGQAMGLPAHTALALAIATARGAAELATRSEETPAQLQQRVTSKGGATFEAIAVFNQAQLASTIAHAMAACSARATAMGNEFGTV